MQTYNLCRCGRKGCPKVHMSNDVVIITDDYGGCVHMDKEEFDRLKEI